MKRWPRNSLLIGSAAALLLAIPAASQESEPIPESLLPPGFEDPTAPAPPRPAADPKSPSPAPGPDLGAAAPLQPAPTDDPAAADLEELAALNVPPPIEIPPEARRDPRVVGPLEIDNWGLGFESFGASNGRYLSTLMRRLDAPLPSRWASILLRRALLSRVPAPAGVAPVDWVAERAWLLLRMGEADAARMLVQSVDVEDFTPKMYGVAVQAALATADPAGLCPLVEGGRATSDEPVWPLADAMCAALEGDAARASLLIDQARRRSGAGGIDLLLAEKVVGAGINTRRAVTIQWEGVNELNSWRYGLSAATGIEIPGELIRTAGPSIQAWQARAAMLPIEQRLAAANVAATLGVFSSASLVEIYSLIADATDPSEMRESVGGRLQQAYVGRTADARRDAFRSLWNEPEQDPAASYARLILTAGAAARVTPSQDFASDAAELISAMLAGGYDRQAARWSALVEDLEGEDADAAWAMLALGAPDPRVSISTGRIGTFQANDGSPGDFRTQLLVAGLAGLGRVDESTRDTLGERYGVDFGRASGWTRAIDRAVQRREPATVVLLAGIGMQTAAWGGVPPEHLYHIVRGLRLAGLEFEARMIAAEALSRS